MIDEQIRQTVRTLYRAGKYKREIARLLNIDIKTVRSILKSEDDKHKKRIDKIQVDEDLLKRLFTDCNGYARRIYEKLTEEHDINIAYSTVTQLVREHSLRNQKERARQFPDIPGAEMQHDTSPFNIIIDGKRTGVVCSGIYFRYSKIRYVIFYPRFRRFEMKCFFHEALICFGFCAKICIIDNTNLAVLHGTGENAVFNPEMLAFARNYGFTWKAHRIKQSNRKAGKERNFLTLETNFFPGRKFKSFEDLNKQAKDWALNRFANRPQSKSHLIPSELFEMEKPYLVKLPDFIYKPYLTLYRKIDVYGYVAYDGNYYYTPEGCKGQAKIIVFKNCIDIYQNHEKKISHKLPSFGVKNKKITPEGITSVFRQPNNRKKKYDVEEKCLREKGDICNRYIDYIKETDIRTKGKFIRSLYRLSKKITDEIFNEGLLRALEYKIDKIDSLERIFNHIIRVDNNNIEIPQADEYENRKIFQDGKISTEADPETYKKLMEDNENE